MSMNRDCREGLLPSRIKAGRTAARQEPRPTGARFTERNGVGRRFAAFVGFAICGTAAWGAGAAESGWAGPGFGRASCYGIQVVDQETGRGVPLVELETVHHVGFVTDNAGRVALAEPGLLDRPVFFHVRSHGYEFPKDGFGYSGVTLTTIRGGNAVLRIQRRNVAERLYRITGEGLYRDSVWLGEATPLTEPLGGGQVVGQDSALVAQYRGRLHWFWGDTSRLRYPLGHFWMAGATSDLPGRGGLDPDQGIELRYFVDAEGFSRPVCRLGVEKGLIWSDAFLVVLDETGRERLVCHYAHMESLDRMLDHGLAIWNDDRAEFERARELDLADRRVFPGQAHPVRHRDGDGDFFYMGEVFPTVRVRADLASVLDPRRRETFTCVAAAPDGSLRVKRDAAGRIRHEWQAGGVPLDPGIERDLVARGELQPGEARFLPADVETGKPVLMHRGTVRWNAFRRRWVMIATETGGTSPLGEVWYAEAEAMMGPWRRARKIVTHDRYSFYNPVHHEFFDQDGGRRIYFEGTYATTFSGRAEATPRYDYNQIMYRLDLADPRLRAAQAEAAN